jgi:hypothetical protein
MEHFSGIEGETTTYNREAVARDAKEQALALLDEKLTGAMELPTGEKILVLRELINELSATVEGTDEPLHNEHRHVVEQLASLLRVEELRQEYEAVLARHPELA